MDCAGRLVDENSIHDAQDGEIPEQEILATKSDAQKEPPAPVPPLGSMQTKHPSIFSDSIASFITWSNLVVLLWLTVVIWLVILNFQSYIWGSSLALKYRSYAVWKYRFTMKNRVDTADHNTAAALQFAAKALEIVFTWIAANLIYDLTRHIARRRHGLPLGFFLTYVEFTDVFYVLTPALWKSTLTQNQGEKSSRRYTRMFLALAMGFMLLTVLVNSMGPATAILLIPKLNWVDDKTKTAVQRFIGADLGKRPYGTMLEGCNASDLDARNFSCTQNAYSTGFEQRLEASLQSEITSGQDLVWDSPFQEGRVKGLTNFSVSDPIAMFVPHRQILQELRGDRNDKIIEDENEAIDTIHYDSALDLSVQREGPAFGFDRLCNNGTVNLIHVSAQKTVACFSNWFIDVDSPVYKCYGVGDFNANPKVSSFKIGNRLVVDVFFSDKAIYFNETTDFGSGVKSCLQNNAQKCDWDRIFDTQTDFGNSTRLKLSQKLLVTTYSPISQNFAPRLGLQNNTQIFYCDHIFYLGFPTYSIRFFYGDNPDLIAGLTANVKSVDNSTLSVDPDWFLATWSVDNNGTVNTTISQKTFQSPLLSPNGSFSDHALEILDTTDGLAISQMLSIAHVNLVNISSKDSTKNSEDGDQTKTANRILYRWTSRYVWAYGCDTRSSQLALTVAIAGCIVALIQVSFRSFSTDHHHSWSPRLTATLIAALRHRYEGELDIQQKGAETKQMRHPRWVTSRLERAVRTLWSNDESQVVRRRYQISPQGRSEHFRPVWNDDVPLDRLKGT